MEDWRRTVVMADPLSDTLEAPAPLDEETQSDAAIVLAVRQALEQLSGTDQIIIRLRYLEEDRSSAEVGELLGITMGAARVRLHRALKHLEKTLKQDRRIADFLRRRGIQG
jgi:RNA polymerase sigma factor (sigma-70 family)